MEGKSHRDPTRQSTIVTNRCREGEINPHLGMSSSTGYLKQTTSPEIIYKRHNKQT